MSSQSTPSIKTYWRIAGGEDHRIGEFLGYENHMVKLRFEDGTEGLYYPHMLFPSEKRK